GADRRPTVVPSPAGGALAKGAPYGTDSPASRTNEFAALFAQVRQGLRCYCCLMTTVVAVVRGSHPGYPTRPQILPVLSLAASAVGPILANLDRIITIIHGLRRRVPRISPVVDVAAIILALVPVGAPAARVVVATVRWAIRPVLAGLASAVAANRGVPRGDV